MTELLKRATDVGDERDQTRREFEALQKSVREMESYALRLEKEHRDMKQNVQALEVASRSVPQSQGSPIDPWMRAAQARHPEFREPLRDFSVTHDHRGTVELDSREPAGMREVDHDVHRLFFPPTSERPVPTSVPQSFAPGLGCGFPSSGMPGAGPAGPPVSPAGRATEYLGPDPVWAGYRPSAVNHVPGAASYAVPEDSKRNWTVRFPAMGLRRGEVTKWEEWLIMSRLAVQAAGTEARVTWENALEDAGVAYAEYSRIDPSIKYSIRPTGDLLPALRMAEAKLLSSLLTVFQRI